MRYVIVDQEGASRGYFDALSDVLDVVDEIRNDEGVEMVSEYCVLKYDGEGNRVGDPIDAAGLLPRDIAEMAGASLSTAVAQAHDTDPSWHAEPTGTLQAA